MTEHILIITTSEVHRVFIEAADDVELKSKIENVRSGAADWIEYAVSIKYLDSDTLVEYIGEASN